MGTTEEASEQVVPLRVLVFNLSGLMFELVEELLTGQPDMVLVGRAESNLELLLAGGDAIDVVIVGAPQLKPLPDICTHVLSEYPFVKILVLTPSGETAMLYRLGLRQRKISRVSGANIIKNLRRMRDLNPIS